MPEEETQPTNTGASTEGSTPPANNQVTVDGAELVRLQAAEARMTALDGIAAEAQVENAEKYVEVLESDFYAKSEGSGTTPEPTPVQTPAPTPTPATTGLSADDKRLLDDSSKRAMAAFIEAQRNGWEQKQRDLPEDQRSSATAPELLKMIYGPTGGLITSPAMVEAFGGNVFAAADHAYNLQGGAKKARAAGAASATAMANAAATANLTTGGKTAEPSTLTPQERQDAWQKEQADAIAPDDDPIE